MAKNALSDLQKDFLEEFFRREDRFFLTGGAALVGFHLGHRETHALDLLTLEDAIEGGFAAKSGKQAEARAELEGLLKSSTERYVSPYSIAMIYNGLGERDETLAWLERGVEQRDPRMTFLKVEPKWNNLRDDPRFTDVLRRVGLR